MATSDEDDRELTKIQLFFFLGKNWWVKRKICKATKNKYWMLIYVTDEPKDKVVVVVRSGQTLLRICGRCLTPISNPLRSLTTPKPYPWNLQWHILEKLVTYITCFNTQLFQQKLVVHQGLSEYKLDKLWICSCIQFKIDPELRCWNELVPLTKSSWPKN